MCYTGSLQSVFKAVKDVMMEDPCACVAFTELGIQFNFYIHSKSATATQDP
jgi:hypothetical protein